MKGEDTLVPHVFRVLQNMEQQIITDREKVLASWWAERKRFLTNAVTNLAQKVERTRMSRPVGDAEDQKRSAMIDDSHLQGNFPLTAANAGVGFPGVTKNASWASKAWGMYNTHKYCQVDTEFTISPNIGVNFPVCGPHSVLETEARCCKCGGTGLVALGPTDMCKDTGTQTGTRLQVFETVKSSLANEIQRLYGEPLPRAPAPLVRGTDAERRECEVKYIHETPPVHVKVCPCTKNIKKRSTATQTGTTTTASALTACKYKTGRETMTKEQLFCEFRRLYGALDAVNR
uniref:Uncharacterized protein n=1 Tax=Trypanosoma congolense (strain IL3000) TaxID=1068625 RepID=G0UVX4_TRYCI|nr:conserved hypothetical protein [Trypanosoma congolense IL3000]